MNRRSFVGICLSAIPAYLLLRSEIAPAKAPAANADAKAEPGKAGAGAADDKTPMVKESDPLAKSLNYCENAEKGKAKVCPTRKEPARKDQFCKGCQFFTAAGKRGKDDVGKCQILQNNLVKATGWCNTFAPKAT